MTLAMIFATRKWQGTQYNWEKCIDTWEDRSPGRGGWTGYIMDNATSGNSLLESYEYAFRSANEDILGFVHDDVLCLEDYWKYRVILEFEDPSVGLVGFGGAKRFGSPDLYKEPYELSQLGRSRFISNMKNAEDHGERFTGECDVAVLDGFVMFVRRSVLEKSGGWPVGTPINYFMYDGWLSAEVRRQGLRTRLVGVACDHLSGKTASMVQLKDSHPAAHQYIYETCRDVLPFEVE